MYRCNGNDPKTLEHLLFYCPAFRNFRERQALRFIEMIEKTPPIEFQKKYSKQKNSNNILKYIIEIIIKRKTCLLPFDMSNSR